MSMEQARSIRAIIDHQLHVTSAIFVSAARANFVQHFLFWLFMHRLVHLFTNETESIYRRQHQKFLVFIFVIETGEEIVLYNRRIKKNGEKKCATETLLDLFR